MLKFERECTDYESALFIRVEYEVARSVDAQSLNARNIVLLISEHSRDLRWRGVERSSLYYAWALVRSQAQNCRDLYRWWYSMTQTDMYEYSTAHTNLYMMLSTAQHDMMLSTTWYDAEHNMIWCWVQTWGEREEKISSLFDDNVMSSTRVCGIRFRSNMREISFQYARDILLLSSGKSSKLRFWVG